MGKEYTSRREFLQKARVKAAPIAREGASLAVLAGGLTYLASFNYPFLQTVKESLYNARHAARTSYEMVSGGPEGMKAVKNLDEALQLVTLSAESNKEARESLENYISKRKELVSELGRVYKENETIGQEAERLKIQLEGTLKNFFEIGNTLKPEFLDKLDNNIMKLYGMDPVQAREKSGRLMEFYKNVRKFYDAREKNEHTVKEFSDYLVAVKEDSIKQNEKFNELFPSVISRVREGYENEDALFNTGEKSILGLRKDVKISDLEKTATNVKKFREGVDTTENDVRKEMPITPYREGNWIDFTLNPLTLGITGALLLKGISNITPVTRKALTYATLSPYYITKSIAKGIVKLKKNQKIKKEANKQI